MTLTIRVWLSSENRKMDCWIYCHPWSLISLSCIKVVLYWPCHWCHCPRPAAGDGGGVRPGGAPWHQRRQTSADSAPTLGGGEVCQTLSPSNSSHVRWEDKSWKFNVIDDNQHLNALEVLQIYFLIFSISCWVENFLLNFACHCWIFPSCCQWILKFETQFSWLRREADTDRPPGGHHGGET